jgi:thiamine-phosphate pyrophosphorylase
MSCRLYLATPLALAEGSLTAEAFLPLLESALSGGDVAAVLLRTGGPAVTPARVSELIALLMPAAQGSEAAFIVEGFLAEAAAAGCDGVQIPATKQAVQQARDQLEDGAIVGAACGRSRHDAMIAGEQGADYVAFGEPGPGGAMAEAAIIAWWQETMLLPSVAMGAKSLQDAALLAEAGADFLLLEDAVWQDPDGPAAAVAWFERQLGA